MPDCIFCKIIRKEIPATIVWESGNAMAFDDNNPKAPVHILIVPKKHLERIDDLPDDDRATAAELVLAIKQIVLEKKLEDGYRIISNNGRHGHQEIMHLHFHLLGGKDLGASEIMRKH